MSDTPTPAARPGILVKLAVSIWTGTAQLAPADLGLDPADVSAIYTLGRKRLVPREALEPIHAAARRARYALDTLSLAMPDGGRFVPRAAVPEVLDALDRHRAAFQDAVARFLDAYPALRARMRPAWEAAALAAWRTEQARHPDCDRQRWVDAWLARVEQAYPAPDALRRKFDFFWYTYQLSLGDFAPVDAALVAREEAERRARDEAYRAEVQRRLHEALERGVAELHAAVAHAFQRLVEHVRSGRPVSPAALGRVRQAIARFRTLNVFGDSDLERALEAFEREGLATLDAARLNQQPALREVFRAGLEQVVEAATRPDGTLNPLTGRLRRSLGDEALEADAAPPEG